MKYIRIQTCKHYPSMAFFFKKKKKKIGTSLKGTLGYLCIADYLIYFVFISKYLMIGRKNWEWINILSVFHMLVNFMHIILFIPYNIIIVFTLYTRSWDTDCLMNKGQW